MIKNYGDYAKNTGTYLLADQPQMYEVQRTNNFEFVVTDLDSILRAGATGDEKNAYLKNGQEVLRVSVSSAFVPHFTQSVINIKRGNNDMKFAGVPTFNAGQLKFRDYIGAETKAYLMAWQNLSYDVNTERVGSLDVTNYKKDCRLIEYTPDYRKVREWILKGCWISEISESPYDHDSNNAGAITVTIQYDKGYINNSDLL
jgi:hypothetical protein